MSLGLTITPAPLDTAPLDTGSFPAPLFTGWQERFHNQTTTRLAASGSMVWVAANEGLREYDLSKRTLGRPANVPPGVATAVVTDEVETWAAVNGALYRRRDGTWRPEPSPHFSFVTNMALDAGTLWAATVEGLFRRTPDGAWKSIEISAPGIDKPQAMLCTAANGIAWAFVGGRDRHHDVLARVTTDGVQIFGRPGTKDTFSVKALAAQHDGSVLVGFDEHGDVDGRHFHRFDGSTWTPLYGCVTQFVPDGPWRVWKPEKGCPGSWRLASSGNRMWAHEINALGSVTRLVQVGGDRAVAPVEPPGEMGPLIGIATSTEGLWVLGDWRLARLHKGHWTVFSAPDFDGTSTERSAMPRPGLLPPTGLTLTPASKQLAVRRPAPPLPPHIAVIGGVPLHQGRIPHWVDGLLNGVNIEDADQYLPEFDPDGRYRFSGLYQGGTLAIQAVDATLGTIPLTRALRAPDGALVTVVAQPVYARCTEEPCVPLRFVPVEESVIVANPERVALAAVGKFHALHHAELTAVLGGANGLAFPAKLEPVTIGYDANRARLFVSVYSSSGRSMLELTYYLAPNGQIEAMAGAKSDYPPCR